MVSDNPKVLQLQLRRHSIKEMDSKHKSGPLGQSFGFLGLRPDIVVDIADRVVAEKILLPLLLILVIVLTKAAPSLFIKWSGEYFLK